MPARTRSQIFNPEDASSGLPESDPEPPEKKQKINDEKTKKNKKASAARLDSVLKAQKLSVAYSDDENIVRTSETNGRKFRYCLDKKMFEKIKDLKRTRNQKPFKTGELRKFSMINSGTLQVSIGGKMQRVSAVIVRKMFEELSDEEKKVLGVKSADVLDGEHRYRDKADFSRENFYAAMIKFLNGALKEPQEGKHKKSKICGVTFHKQFNKWHVKIRATPGAARKSHGLFHTEIEAILALFRERNSDTANRPDLRSLLAFYNDNGDVDPRVITFPTWEQFALYCRPSYRVYFAKRVMRKITFKKIIKKKNKKKERKKIIKLVLKYL